MKNVRAVTYIKWFVIFIYMCVCAPEDYRPKHVHRSVRREGLPMVSTVQTWTAFSTWRMVKSEGEHEWCGPKGDSYSFPALVSICCHLQDWKTTGEGGFCRPTEGVRSVSWEEDVSDHSESKAGCFGCPYGRSDSFRQSRKRKWRCWSLSWVGLGWPWGQDEVERMRKIQVVGERYWIREMEDLNGFWKKQWRCIWVW